MFSGRQQPLRLREITSTPAIFSGYFIAYRDHTDREGRDYLEVMTWGGDGKLMRRYAKIRKIACRPISALFYCAMLRLGSGARIHYKLGKDSTFKPSKKEMICLPEESQ